MRTFNEGLILYLSTALYAFCLMQSVSVRRYDLQIHQEEDGRRRDNRSNHSMHIIQSVLHSWMFSYFFTHQQQPISCLHIYHAAQKKERTRAVQIQQFLKRQKTSRVPCLRAWLGCIFCIPFWLQQGVQSLVGTMITGKGRKSLP